MILETIGKLLLRRKESRDFFTEIVILVHVNTVQCFSLMILRISFVTFYNYLYRSYTRHLFIKYDHFSRLLLHLRHGEFVISLTDQTFSCKSEREVLVSLSTVTNPVVISFSNRRISVSEVLSGRLQIIFVTALQKNRNLVRKSILDVDNLFSLHTSTTEKWERYPMSIRTEISQEVIRKTP